MTDKEKLKEIKKLADAMYYAAFNLTTDASLLRKAMKEYHQFIIHEYCKEEPVAPKVLEDMLNAKTAAESLGISQEEHDRIVDELIYGKEPELVDVDDLPNKEEEPVSEELEEAAWLYYDRNRPPMPSELDLHKELIDFFKAGAKWQKSKMVRNAMGGEVKFSDAECRGYRGDFWIESRFLTPYEANEYVGGEKVKLIIIKED